MKSVLGSCNAPGSPVRLVRGFHQETCSFLPKVLSKISGGSPSVQSKPVYRVKNGSSYNRALVASGSLTVWVDDGLWKQWVKGSGKTISSFFDD